jgi:hypothetical protein
MRYLVSIVFLLLACVKIQSQEFAPVGAEWYYHEGFAFSGDVDYIKFTSEKDTLIHGEICRKISKRHKLWCNDRPLEEYIFSRNDTVFFLDTVFNEFQILYNFSAEVKSSWIIKTRDENKEIDTIAVSVDSISHTLINGQQLKTLFVTYEKRDEYMPYTYSSKIMERIGDPMYLFNWTHFSQVACDINWTRGLRCYYDVKLGLYSTGMADSCNYTFEWTSVENQLEKYDFTAFPNPTTGMLEIRYNHMHPIDIEIKNLSGITLLKRTNIYSGNIDFSHLPSGIYIVQGTVNSEVLGIVPIVKL